MGYYSMVSIEKPPLISVITVVYNGDKHIAGCIQNIADQTYKNIEHIIIDGGSTDKTVNILSENNARIKKWITESDKGIGDAMNKGIGLASGDYLIFIHSDDYFFEQTSVEQMVENIGPNTDILLSKVLFGEQRKTILKARNFNFLINFKLGFCHQGVVCRRKLFDDLGTFDEQFRITMDYDFFLRAYRHGIRSSSTGQILAVMRDTGISSRVDWKSLHARFKEERLVHKKNCDYLFKKVIYAAYWSLYLPYRKLKSIL
jgi:glycosyltransferase involved in cell wall biosynthesis